MASGVLTFLVSGSQLTSQLIALGNLFLEWKRNSHIREHEIVIKENCAVKLKDESVKSQILFHVVYSLPKRWMLMKQIVTNDQKRFLQIILPFELQYFL